MCVQYTPAIVTAATIYNNRLFSPGAKGPRTASSASLLSTLGPSTCLSPRAPGKLSFHRQTVLLFSKFVCGNVLNFTDEFLGPLASFVRLQTPAAQEVEIGNVFSKDMSFICQGGVQSSLLAPWRCPKCAVQPQPGPPGPPHRPALGPVPFTPSQRSSKEIAPPIWGAFY